MGSFYLQCAVLEFFFTLECCFGKIVIVLLCSPEMLVFVTEVGQIASYNVVSSSLRLKFRLR